MNCALMLQLCSLVLWPSCPDAVLPVAFFAACMLMLRHYVDFTISLHILSGALGSCSAMFAPQLCSAMSKLFVAVATAVTLPAEMLLPNTGFVSQRTGEGGREGNKSFRTHTQTHTYRRMCLLWSHTQKWQNSKNDN